MAPFPFSSRTAGAVVTALAQAKRHSELGTLFMSLEVAEWDPGEEFNKERRVQGVLKGLQAAGGETAAGAGLELAYVAAHAGAPRDGPRPRPAAEWRQPLIKALAADGWTVTPWSEDNCAYQATKAAVELLGGDPAMIATVAGSLGTALTLVPATAPLGAGLLAVASVASAYAAGEEAGNGEELQAAIDALGSVLGGSATAERLLKELAQLAPALAGESAVEQREALVKLLDEAGAFDLAASVANTLCPLE